MSPDVDAPADLPPPPPPPVYADERAFYRDYFSPVFARGPKAQGFSWCPQPWEHPEFTEVMKALWNSWEYMHREDPAMGMAVWFVNYAYPLLDRLSFYAGTFAICTRKEGGHDQEATIRPLADAVQY